MLIKSGGDEDVRDAGKPTIKLANCSDFRVIHCYQYKEIALFMKEDEKCSNIVLKGDNLTGTTRLSLEKDANFKAEFNWMK